MPKPNYDPKLLDLLQSKIDSLKDPQSIAQNKGIGGGKLIEAYPEYDRAEGEIIGLRGENNQWVVLGRDRPASRFSGAAGTGATQAGMIDIVVGRMSAAKEIKPNTKAAPNFFDDAARIYISQKSRIDANFGLDPGSRGIRRGMCKDVAAIGIKADEVRMIARTGIKLVTGKGVSGEKTAHGNLIETVGTIDFIAGNDSSKPGLFKPKNLQPLVKGNNLKNLLREIMKHVSHLNSIVFSALENQKKFNQALLYHVHAAPLIGTTGPSYSLPASYVKNTIRNQETVLLGITEEIGRVTVEGQYLMEFGDEYICSKYVNTT